MADETIETAAPPDTAEWRQKIEDKIDRLAEILKGGSHEEQGSETEPDEPASMAAEVRREVERLRDAEAAQHREQERDQQVADLSAKVSAIPERQPREYRRSTRFMKWAEDDDK